ncbi:16S rRNA (cytidine(1402)-2'-O)-methyltransferase [Corynebacterium striatum]|uniref:16S rRNA (cytidine(1402)-2'-O)-methyltransferase n=1 Tax=Corynebacterium striatum TaxID=43770 RepID=UPI00254A61C2|nr:16S rRNA (cytidine(1402)-2'-O)-methyltransferase [Corynebacterium striatum]MDK7885236.1 16S rRNA (cytidine(1402)-2'-O)-methyltransferase [Corynebacterium striatum]
MNTNFRLEPLPRGVIVAATPLGNIGDASARLMQALAEADVVAAEDTRRVRNLASALGIEIQGKVVSNFDHNESQRAQALVDAARSGTVLVVSDAGMPLVSDPGHSIVAAAVEAGVPVTCFPGPSAVPTALALSGLGVGHFLFDAFAPRKVGPRKTWLESLKGQERAIVFFESPHRLAQTLSDAADILGAQRSAAVCRELSKTYEEIKRGTLGELAQWAVDNARGEITVVIEGGASEPASVEVLVERVHELVSSGMRAKDACKEAAAGTEVTNRDLYDAYLAARDA